jgi:DNA invertase Pin-like site-specific DNA recombinase
MNVAIYSRVSTEDRQEPKNQLRALREFATIQGWTVTGEYTDRATGRNGDRPQFQAVMRDASRHKFDLLLFWSLDRLTREGAVKTIVYLDQLSRAGVKYKSFTEPYLDTTAVFGEMVVLLLATLAKFESQRLGERTKAGMARAKAEGKHCGRPREPFNLKLAQELRKDGLTITAIAKKMRVSRARVWTRLREPGKKARSRV